MTGYRRLVSTRRRNGPFTIYSEIADFTVNGFGTGGVILGPDMKNLAQRIEGTLYREADLRAVGTIDKEKRTVRISVSSELPVLRVPFFDKPWLETLGHERSEVDLARLKNGATVHYNHSRAREDRIGVVESATIVDRRLEATVRFSKSDRVNDVWDDVRDGVLRNISVGYRVNKRVLTKESKEGAPDEFRVTSWTPMEVSFVDIPADPTVGVGRDDNGNLAYRVIDLQIERDKTMSGNNKGDGNVTHLPAVHDALQAEQVRRREIHQCFSTFQDQSGVVAIRDECKDDMQCTVVQARERLLTFLGSQSSPAGGDSYRTGEYRGDAHITFSDGGDEFCRAAADALCIRSGIRLDKPHPGAKDLTGVSILDMARMHLSHRGVSTGRMAKGELIKRAMTTSDFPLLLADAADKSVIAGYLQAAGTHRGWTRQSFAKDFKAKRFVAAGETPDLDLVNEEGEFKYGQLVETGTSVALQTYGKLLAFSRQSMINDDTGELLGAARSFGQSAMRLEADLAYGNLVANPVMSDGNTLFHATHNNIATAAVPSVTSLGDMRELLRKQKGLGGSAFLDLQPFAVLAPAALETTLEQLLSSLFDPFPATGTSDSAARNPFANRLELIVDPRLDDDSATRWYLITDPNAFNWSERIALEGQPNPFVEEQLGWAIDGTEIKVRHDFAVLITEYRGIVKNDGV